MIVVGYGGSDDNIMANVFEASMNDASYAAQGIFWCVRKDRLPPKRYLDLARKHSGRLFWLEIESFDWLFAQLEEEFAPRGKEPYPEDLLALYNDLAVINPVLVAGIDALSSNTPGGSGEAYFRNLGVNLNAAFGFMAPFTAMQTAALRFGIPDAIPTEKLLAAIAGSDGGAGVAENFERAISAMPDKSLNIEAIPIRVNNKAIGVAVLGLRAATSGEIRHSTIKATLLGIFATVWPRAITGSMNASAAQG
jgi:hypothetical protein